MRSLFKRNSTRSGCWCFFISRFVFVTGPHVFGKHPEWPEDFEKAKLRYLERFESICKICAAKGANPIIVGHADMITIVLQTIGGVETKSCGYCGWVVGERLARKSAFDCEWRLRASREVGGALLLRFDRDQFFPL